MWDGDSVRGENQKAGTFDVKFLTPDIEFSHPVVLHAKAIHILKCLL